MGRGRGAARRFPVGACVSELRDLTEQIVRAPVDEPEEVFVVEERGVVLSTVTVSVAPADVGRVIGQGGEMIGAIRRLVGCLVAAAGRRSRVEVVNLREE